MAVFRKVFINFLHSPKKISPNLVFLPLTLRSLPVIQYQIYEKLSSSPVKYKDEELPSSLFKYEKFSNKTAPVVLDVEEERRKVLEEESTRDEFQGICLERGVTGVIDVQEVVELLRREKAQDIFVVKVPPEYNYADYKVIVTGRSHKHMVAMATFIRKVYKLKAQDSNMPPRLEGKNSKQWVAIDLGNIILHVFSSESRKIYDLETLWALGKEYDSLSYKQDTSFEDLSDYAKILASLTPNE